MTNGDKIRGMTDEELAIMIGDSVLCSECPAWGDTCSMTPKQCHNVWLEWIKQEATE